MIEIITAMIKTKFGFFQVQVESMFGHTIELSQTSFSETPERLDTINMPLATGKLIVTMVNPEVLIKADIDQSVITTPSIGMDYGIRRYMPTDNGLQCCFRTIWNNLRINLSLALKHTKDNCFAISATTSFTSNTLCPKVGFIDLYRTLQRRFKFTILGNSLSYFKINGIDGSDRNAGQLGCVSSSKIHRKTSNKLPEFCFPDSRTKIVSVFNIHLRKLTHFCKCLTS